MLEFSGVGLTDEVNLYKHKFTLKAIHSGYLDVWEEGVPSYFNHDHRKHLGWTKLSGIYLEPHTAYLTNKLLVGETDEERKNLELRSYNQLYKKRVTDRIEKYEELKEKLGVSLSDQAIPCWVNAVSFFDRDIVSRILPELCNKVNKGLISIAELKYIQPGIYEKDGWLIFAHKYFRRGFSYLNTFNEPFLKLLQESSDLFDTKIALDMNCIGLLGTQEAELEYQYWWGPKFNEDLNSIPAGVTVYKNEYYDGLLSDVLKTEFGWYIQDGIQTFECEEITDVENISDNEIGCFGCRFVHSMVSNITNRPYHLDGAIRAYSMEKMLQRLDVDIKHCGRDTQYKKLWRIDGDINIPLWKELITHYYRDNMQIGEYFNGVDYKLDLSYTKQTNCIETEQTISVESFIPLDMKEGDGLRINFSYDYLDLSPGQFDVVIRPTQHYTIGNKIHKFYESDTLSVCKFLKKQGFKVRMPFCERTATEDLIYNFPLFVCKNNEVANAINDCFQQLCEIWISHGDNRLISYSIKINYGTKSILLSYAGHIKDFQKWYNTPYANTPELETNVEVWMENAYSFLNTFAPAHNIPRLSKLKGEKGILLFPKKFVDKRYVEKITNNKKGIYAQLKLNLEEYEIVKENKIWICAMYIIKHSKCSCCKLPYEQCTCPKYFLPDVTEIMEDIELVGFVWTNRTALIDSTKN